MPEEEDKQLPAAAEMNGGSQLQLPGAHQVIKATERIEMHRAAAEVYASLQMALERPRDEALCLQKIEALCNNADFAAGALYVMDWSNGPRVEGINVKAAREIARIWGNLNYGFIEHGRYANETQMEAYATDLETNVRECAKFTVKHERKANNVVQIITDPGMINQHCKAQAAKEVRNVVLHAIGYLVREKIIKWCKRTMHSEVRDVKAAFATYVERFAAVGISKESLLRYANKKSEKDLTVAEIVELRVLLETAKEDRTIIEKMFPERDKSKKAPEPAQQADAKLDAKPQETQKKVVTSKPVNPSQKKTDEVPASMPAEPSNTTPSEEGKSATLAENSQPSSNRSQDHGTATTASNVTPSGKLDTSLPPSTSSEQTSESASAKTEAPAEAESASQTEEDKFENGFWD